MNRLHLLVEHDRNRELLADWLTEYYEVSTAANPVPEETDLVVVDEPGFDDHVGALDDWKADTDPVFAPVLLVTEQGLSEEFDPEHWETIDGLYVIDEVVTMPVEKTVLHRRIENLLERRDLSTELATQYERSEERFASLFRATPDPAFVLIDDHFTYVDDEFCDVCELDRDLLHGRTLAEVDCFDDESLATLRHQRDAARSDGDPETEIVELQGGDGQRRVFESNVNAMTLADGDGVVFVLHDVTERREREHALRETEPRFEQIAANVAELIWMIDVETGTVEYVSPGFEEMLGSDFEATAYQPPSEYVDLVHPDDRDTVEATVEAMLADAVAGDVDEEYHFEFRVRNPDRGTRWLEGHGYPIRDERGDVHRYVGVFEDFTEFKRRERELQRQNERLEEFAGIVSHDLRNPLQVLSARLAQVSDDGDVGEHVPPMQRSVERMESLIDDLLTLARQGEAVTDTTAVALSAVAARAWDTVDAPEATLRADTDAVVEADESRLRQLLENLFRNSVDHAGQDVTIRLGTLDDRPGFYVEDDGPGIPDDDREAIFEAGYTTDHEGTGFGLNIVSEIVHAHGWTITATDGTDGGARFEIET
ncbi:MAG: PAS domain S-box protein [Haloarculaceae archaeon]